MTKSNNNPNNICPFLGLSDDTTSHMAFTSPENFCHRCKPIVQIKLEHQNDYCLDAEFKNCPIYVNDAGKRMPADLVYDGRTDRRSAPLDRRILWAGIILAGIFVIITLFFFIRSFNSRENQPIDSFSISAIQSLTAIASSPTSLPPTEMDTATPTGSPSSSTSLPIFTATITLFPTLTPTAPTSTPTITFTATPVILKTATQIPPHSLEVPIGKDQLYLIHKVADGENLSTLAEKYKTSLEAILEVNSTLVIPIRIDAVVIIPLKNDDPLGLPKLEPYQVTQSQITPETLAELLKVDLALFKSLNDFKDGEELVKGNWVLIPR
ncbi:MAG: LysM peptidoglycan-binding domain-containing protein [Chloroflexi bacterium]|nr:LysM peptidoglycan-binding domain-containing protein [Chloroflexota bacterium]